MRHLNDCKEVGQDVRGFPVFTRDLPIEAIKTITLGERMSLPKQREVFARIMDTKVGLSQAAIDLSGYAFRREIIKYPVPISEMPPVLTPRTAHIFSELDNQFVEFARALLRVHPLSKIVNIPV